MHHPAFHVAHQRRHAPHEPFSTDQALEVASEGSFGIVAIGFGGYLPALGPILAVDAIRRSARVAAHEGSPALDRLAHGFSVAHDLIKRAAALAGPHGAYAGLGACATAAILEGDTLAVAHVGDTRAYCARGGKIAPLTTDQMLSAPHERVVAQAIGLRDAPSPALQTIAVEPGDVIVLASSRGADELVDGLASLVASNSALGLDQLAAALAARVAGGVAVARVA